MPIHWREFSGSSRFFLRSRRVSRLTLRQYLLAWFRTRQVTAAIDELTDDLPEEFYIPRSTAYSWLAWFREQLRLHCDRLGLDPGRLRTTSDLMVLAEESWTGAIEALGIGLSPATAPQIRPPP